MSTESGLPDCPEPWLDHGDVRVWHGDCANVMPTLGREYDLLLTDPPYGISVPDIHRTDARGDRRTLRRNFFADDTVDAPLAALEMAIGLLKDDAGAFVYCGHRQFGAIEDMLHAAGFQTGPFAWVKTNAAPSVRKHSWRSSIEVAVWATRGSAFRWHEQETALNHIRAACCANVHPEKNGHPMQKPTGTLLQAIRHYTDPGGLILDPFAGSGSTLAAARKLGRRADGIERDAEHLPRIESRLAQTTLITDGVA